MKIRNLAPALGLSALALTALAASPYAGQESRDIKALSRDEVGSLLSGEGMGFAIPMDTVKRFLNHRDAYAYDSDNPSNAYRYLAPPSRLNQASASVDGEK